MQRKSLIGTRKADFFVAFILYRQHYQAQVVAQNPGLANPEISKIIGEQWREQEPEVKSDWKRSNGIRDNILGIVTSLDGLEKSVVFVQSRPHLPKILYDVQSVTVGTY